MKIAAIYPRKSTDQNADEAKSVTRLIEPRQFTEEDCAVAHVGVIRHVDDGVERLDRQQCRSDTGTALP
jgi:hypothetical protein